MRRAFVQSVLEYLFKKLGTAEGQPHTYQAKGNFRPLCSKPVCTLWVGCALTGVSGGEPGSQTPSERRNWGGEFLAWYMWGRFGSPPAGGARGGALPRNIEKIPFAFKLKKR